MSSKAYKEYTVVVKFGNGNIVRYYAIGTENHVENQAKVKYPNYTDIELKELE